MDYLKINKQLWNNRTKVHVNSKFYDIDGFILGNSTLNKIELDLLGDINQKKILHLQCHFGLDTISLSKLGAIVTGIDFSEISIKKARDLNDVTKSNVDFICCDLYSLPEHLNEKFDIVFTSYGTIIWLPDLEKWASIIQHYLKTGGTFIIADFHPLLSMFDESFKELKYSYFNIETIVETEEGTYADKNADLKDISITWNHSFSELFTALIKNKLQINSFQEFDYSPYNCFNNLIEIEKGNYQLKNKEGILPMVFALKATKTKQAK